MNRNFYLFLVLLLFCSIGWYSCSNFNLPEPTVQELNLPDQPFDYVNSEFPESFAMRTDQTPADNQITDNGATLGRVLFYDGKLSLNNSTSCASCHDQKAAFSDVVAKSMGFTDQETKRNSPPIFNTRFMNSFFWDSRINDMEEQAIMPIADHIEMGLDDKDMLLAKLNSSDYYPQLFKNAFGDETINMDRVKKALAQFLRSINSYNSKFDKGLENEFRDFTFQELKGMEIFNNAQCNNCHALEGMQQIGFMLINSPDLFDPNIDFFIDELIGFPFGMDEQANIGLDAEYTDKGIYDLTGLNEDAGKFKIPSLRNIMLTGPYMHDGRFASIDAVLEHYDKGIIDHENLDNRLRSGMGNHYQDAQPTAFGAPVIFDFDEDDKAALIAFFGTLTDNTLINDEKFSSPFK